MRGFGRDNNPIIILNVAYMYIQIEEFCEGLLANLYIVLFFTFNEFKYHSYHHSYQLISNCILENATCFDKMRRACGMFNISLLVKQGKRHHFILTYTHSRLWLNPVNPELNMRFESMFFLKRKWKFKYKWKKSQFKC